MKFFLHSFALSCLLAFTAFSQTPKSTPPPVVDDDIVKISTTLIQVDVTVTNTSGKIITDLKPEDFQIFENGKKQSITNFSFISANRSLPNAPAEKRKPNTNLITLPPTETKLRPEQIHRTIALVVDDLTLSFESMHFVRRALRKFVNEQMQEGDLVAIIRSGGGIGALQQFTADKHQLLAAIKKVRWNPRGAGGVGAFASIEPTPLEIAKAGGADVSEEQLEEERNQLQRFSEFRENIFATGTLGAMNYVIRGMNKLPGRKAVMLISDGFSLNSTTPTGFTVSSTRIRESLLKLVDLANRSSVVIYSIDPRGLLPVGFTAADNTTLIPRQRTQQRITDRRSKFFDSQESLTYLAKETGGFAILNSNDINGGIKKILSDQSYYLLGYQPDTDTFDPNKNKFNKLEVKVKRKDVKVRYRSGFFGVTNEKTKAAKTESPSERIVNALTSPFAVNDIELRLNSVFKGDEKNNLSLQSFVHIDTANLKFVAQSDGKKVVVFDLLAMSFGDNGVPNGKISKTYTIRVNNEQYKKALKLGFTYFFSFPVKTAGAYQMRIALRDHGNNKVGSASQFIEVPTLRKNRLVLSGFVLENLPYKQWKKNQETGTINSKPDPFLATSLRQFKNGTVLTYGYEIYNSKVKNKQNPQLEVQTRLFYNGKILYQGEKKPIDVSQQFNLGVIKSSGALNLGTKMKLGSYVLQLVVTDKLAKRKRQTAAQFVQFEIVE